MRRYWLDLIARFEREAGLRPSPVFGVAMESARPGEAFRVQVGAPNRMTTS